MAWDGAMDRWVSEGEGDDENDFSEWVDGRQARGKRAVLSLISHEPTKPRPHGHAVSKKAAGRRPSPPPTTRGGGAWDSRIVPTSGIPTYDALDDKHCRTLMQNKTYRTVAKRSAYRKEAARAIRHPRNRGAMTDDTASEWETEPQPSYYHREVQPLSMYKEPAFGPRRKSRSPTPKPAWGDDVPKGNLGDAGPLRESDDIQHAADGTVTPPAEDMTGLAAMAHRNKDFTVYSKPAAQRVRRPGPHVHQRGRTRPHQSADPRGARPPPPRRPVFSQQAPLPPTSTTIDNSININTVNNITTSMPPGQQEDLLKLLYLQQEMAVLRATTESLEAEKSALNTELDEEKAAKIKLQLKLNEEMQKKVKSAKLAERESNKVKDLTAQNQGLSMEVTHLKDVCKQTEQFREKHKAVEHERQRVALQLRQKDELCRELQFNLKHTETRVKDLEATVKGQPATGQQLTEQSQLNRKLKREMKARAAGAKALQELQDAHDALVAEVKVSKQDHVAFAETTKQKQKELEEQERLRQRQQEAAVIELRAQFQAETQRLEQRASQSVSASETQWRAEKEALMQELERRAQSQQALEAQLDAIQRQLQREAQGAVAAQSEAQKHADQLLQVTKHHAEKDIGLKRAKDEVVELKNHLTTNEGKVSKLSEQVVGLQRREVTLNEQRTQLETKLKQMTEREVAYKEREATHKKEAKRLEGECEGLKAERKDLIKRLAEEGERRGRKEEELKGAEARIAAQQKSLREAQEAQKKVPKVEEMEAKWAEADRRAATLSEANSTILLRLKKEEERCRAVMDVLAKHNIEIPSFTHVVAPPSVMRL